MKIFFYSTVFAPSVGGIETLVETLCRQFVALGHEVTLATETQGATEMPFGIVRRPGRGRVRKLLAWCDVHVQANVSLKSAWVWFVAPRKTIYQHNNVYQRDDGTQGMVDRLKTALAFATPGIANSSYTAARTGASHVVLNAYDDAVFRSTRPWPARDCDLVFLGRLVSQKGCDTLLGALGRVRDQDLRPRLTVIGDGPDRPMLERLCDTLSIADQVRFAGVLQGAELAEELNRHRVMVVPSSYEEPFGIVALEGLACGCIPIVSERGGLVDAIGGHGFTFPNGDATALAARLEHVLRDIEGARKKLEGVEDHLAHCRARPVAERYLAVFRQHIERRG